MFREARPATSSSAASPHARGDVPALAAARQNLAYLRDQLDAWDEAHPAEGTKLAPEGTKPEETGTKLSESPTGSEKPNDSAKRRSVEEKVGEWMEGVTSESVSDAINKRIDESIASGEFRTRSDAERGAIAEGAKEFFNSFHGKSIKLSDGLSVYFAPDPRSRERGLSNAEAWAEYAIHAVTSGGRRLEGRNYNERLFNPTKRGGFALIESTVKAERCGVELKDNPDRDTIIFFGETADGGKFDVVTHLDEAGNMVADLTEITVEATTKKRKNEPRVMSLPEAVKTVVLHQATGSNPSSGTSQAQPGEDVNRKTREIPKGDGTVVVAGPAVKLANADNTKSYKAVPVFIDLGDSVNDEHPDFPPEAQNRSMDSRARDEKANGIAAHLQIPRILPDGQVTLGGGAPVYFRFEKNGKVLRVSAIGNTRLRALKILDRAGKLGDYYDAVRERAGKLGVDVSKMARPTFGYELVGDYSMDEVAEIVTEGNKSDVADMPASGVAIDDARKAIRKNPKIAGFGRPLLDMFDIGKNGEISEDFLRAFAEAVGATAADGYFDEVHRFGGKVLVPAQKLRDRAERAMVASVLDGPGLARHDLQRALDLLYVKENNLGNVRKGLAKAAGKLARAFAKNPDFSLAKDFFDALNAYNTARVRISRKEIGSVAEHFNQETIDFGEGAPAVSDEARQIALLFDRFKSSYTKVAAVFDAYADSVYRPADPAAGRHEEFFARANAETGEQTLFGEGPVVTDKKTLLARAVSSAVKAETDGELPGLSTARARNGAAPGADDETVRLASHEMRQVREDAARKFGNRPASDFKPTERIATVFVEGRAAFGKIGASAPVAEIVYRYLGGGKVAALARLAPQLPQGPAFGSALTPEQREELRRKREETRRIMRSRDRNNGWNWPRVFEPVGGISTARARNSVSVEAAARLGVTNAEAERLEREGYFPDEIFRRTGWYRDDGQSDDWRYEVGRLKFNGGLNGLFQTTWRVSALRTDADDSANPRIPLDQLLAPDDETLRAYPQFSGAPSKGGVQVVFAKGRRGSHVQGFWQKGRRRIVVYVNPDSKVTLGEELRANEDRFREVLAHELQHAIQREEGWATGSNKKNFSSRITKEGRVLQSALDAAETAVYAARNKIDGKIAIGGETWNAWIASADKAVATAEASEAVPRDLVEELRTATEGLKSALRSVRMSNTERGGALETAHAKYERAAGEVQARVAGMREFLTDEEARDNIPTDLAANGYTDVQLHDMLQAGRLVAPEGINKTDLWFDHDDRRRIFEANGRRDVRILTRGVDPNERDYRYDYDGANASEDARRNDFSASEGDAAWGDLTRTLPVVGDGTTKFVDQPGRSTIETRSIVEPEATKNIEAQPNHFYDERRKVHGLEIDGKRLYLNPSGIVHGLVGRRAAKNAPTIMKIGDVLNGSVEVPGVNGDQTFRIAPVDFGKPAFALFVFDSVGGERRLSDVLVLHSINVKTAPAARPRLATDGNRLTETTLAQIKQAWQEIFLPGLTNRSSQKQTASGVEEANVSLPAGRQKQAGVNYPDAGAEIKGLDLGGALDGSTARARNRAEVVALLQRKRPDLDAEETTRQVYALKTPKERKLALHWVVRGAIRLPEDAYKVEDAVSVAEKAKVDPFQYASPLALMEAHKQFKPSARPTDPATVPELTDPRDEGDGIVSYLVQDDEKGKWAMRRIIDTHWGEDANPWCLLQAGNVFGERVIDPNNYWQRYSALPKRVAFKDGKLLAFMATERSEDIDEDDENWDYETERQLRESLPNLAREYDEWAETEDGQEEGASFVEWLDVNHYDEYISAIENTTEQWWDRQDVSHPNLDWARGGASTASESYAADGGTARARNATAAEAARLDAGPTIRVYRAMQLRDGKLYPPMAGKVDGKWQNPAEIGRWLVADERPDLADEQGRFKLDKGNGSSIKAAYNPYWHTSRSPLNDQFSSAWRRPELVTVEVEVPASELTSGYRAEKAKDAVGEMSWHSGPVSSKLAKAGKERRVILSRYCKVVRIVPDAEVADRAAEMLRGTGIAVPANTVTPSLRRELLARGVEVAPTKEVPDVSEPATARARGGGLPAYELNAQNGLPGERMDSRAIIGFRQADILARMRGLVPGYDYQPVTASNEEFVRRGVEIVENDPDAVERIERMLLEGPTRPLSAEEQYVAYVLTMDAEAQQRNAMRLVDTLSNAPAGSVAPGQIVAARALMEAAKQRAVQFAQASQSVGTKLGQALQFRKVAYRWNGLLTFEGLMRDFQQTLEDKAGGWWGGLMQGGAVASAQDVAAIKEMFAKIQAVQQAIEHATNAADAKYGLYDLLRQMKKVEKALLGERKHPFGQRAKAAREKVDMDAIMAKASEIADEVFRLFPPASDRDPLAIANATNIVKKIGDAIIQNGIDRGAALPGAEAFVDSPLRRPWGVRARAFLGRDAAMPPARRGLPVRGGVW